MFFTQFLWHKACRKTSNWRCCLSLEALTSIPARSTIIYRFLCGLHAFSCARASKLNHQICVCACTYIYIYIHTINVSVINYRQLHALFAQTMTKRNRRKSNVITGSPVVNCMYGTMALWHNDPRQGWSPCLRLEHHEAHCRAHTWWEVLVWSWIPHNLVILICRWCYIHPRIRCL